MKFVFLICTERSGSNLITSIANAHSQISGPPPSHLFRLFGLNAENYSPLNDKEKWCLFLDDFVEARNAMLGDWNTDFNREQLEIACRDRSMRSAFEFMYGLEAKNEDASAIFVKENYTYLIIDFLNKNWPNCHFIHLVRDPRDVASSWMNTGTVPGGIKKAIDTWTTDQIETLKLFSERGGEARLLTLRYEDLLSNPILTLSKMCDHIGLAFDSGMLNYSRDIRTRRNASRIDAWKNLAKPIMSDNIGKYKQHLSQEEIRYVELRCSELMKAFGYVSETFQLSSVASTLTAELEKLEPCIRLGQAQKEFSENEGFIRQKRQAVIKRVLDRAESTE